MQNRLERIQELLDEAVDLPPRDRAAFVRGQSDDDHITTEVLSLLAAYTRADALMPDVPLGGVVPELSLGEHVGSCVVEERIGAGGMGVVYRARDTTLQREVALKTIAGNRLAGSQGWARLEREARALAALNHPGIAAIHALERIQGGAIVLVLEYVPGPTLADLMKDGRISVERAVAVAGSIAQALGAAHAAGIIHRDLKPANIKLDGESRAKLLDFGLAKDTGAATDAGATIEGVVMGTASYMSPEQARGHHVDERTDIWAWGCVVFEMLAGAQAFRGDTPSDCIANVLTREPDWSLLPPETPAHVPTLLRRCLQKNADERWHSIADVRLELQHPHAASQGVQVSRRRALQVGTLLAGGLAVGGGLGYFLGQRGRNSRASWPVRFRIDLSPRALVTSPPGAFSISPNGRAVLVTCEESRNTPGTLWLHRLDGASAEELPNSQFSWAMCFSPDGALFARSQVGKAIEVRRISDGTTQTYESSEYEPRGMTWVDAGSIVLAASASGVLQRLDLRTGATSTVTTLDTVRGEHAHIQPCAIPGRRAVLFTCLSEDPTTRRFQQALHAVDLATGARTVVLENAYRPRIVGEGTLVFARGTSIRRVRFDARSFRVLGDSSEIATLATAEEAMPYARFDASPGGVVVLDPCPRNFENSQVSFQPFGGAEKAVVRTGPEGVGIDVARDERTIVVAQGWEKYAIVVYYLEAQNSRWLGERSTPALNPLLSPDARTVVYSEQTSPTSTRIMIAPTDTSTPPRVLVEREGATALLPSSFSPDGAWLYFTATLQGSLPDLYRVQVASPGEFQRVLPDEGRIKRMSPALSPDGALLAFTSTIGGDTGLYLARAPDFAQRVRASKRLGMRPQWSADGRFLFYIDFENLHRVEVTREPTLSVSEPQVVAANIANSAFRVAPSGTGVYLCSPPGGRDARATTLEVITGLGWS